MRRVEAVLSDLDGTLFDTNLRIPPSSLEVLAILRKNDIQLLPVTGRGYRDVGDILKVNAITGLGVFNGGATIVNIRSDELLLDRVIEPEQGRELIESAKHIASVIGFGRGRMLTSDIDAHSIHDPLRSIWIELERTKKESAIRMLSSFSSLTFHISQFRDPRTIGIQVTPQGVDKKSGTMQMLRMLNIDPSNTMAIGDDLNDLPLLEVSPTNVAMGNAPLELQKKAAFVTSTIQHDGFAKAIMRHALGL